MEGLGGLSERKPGGGEVAAVGVIHRVGGMDPGEL